MSAPKAYVEKLQKLQNRALRISYLADRYTSNIELNKRAKLFPLYLCRKLEICKVMFKRMHCKPSTQSVNRPTTRYNETNPPNFVAPKTQRFLSSITYQAPKIWADLPNRIKSIVDTFEFEREIRKYFLAEMNCLTRI